MKPADALEGLLLVGPAHRRPAHGERWAGRLLSGDGDGPDPASGPDIPAFTAAAFED